MRVYFERWMICECGERERQTANKTSFDWIGQALAERQERSFRRLHKKGRCNRKIRYSEWIIKY